MTDNQDPDHNRRKLAKGMHYMTWIVLLAMLAVFFNDYEDGQNNPNRDLRLTSTAGGEVVLDRNRSGHYVAPGQINGQPVTFLVDTGATHVSVPESLAGRLGLERGREQRSMTANGVISVYATRLNSVRLGNIELRNVQASINPFMPEDTVLLGMSFMQHLELIQRDGQLTLRIPAS